MMDFVCPLGTSKIWILFWIVLKNIGIFLAKISKPRPIKLPKIFQPRKKFKKFLFFFKFGLGKRRLK